MTLSVQSTTADRSASSAFEVISTGAALAAEVRGIDLRCLDDGTFGPDYPAQADLRASSLLVSKVPIADERLRRKEGSSDEARPPDGGGLRRCCSSFRRATVAQPKLWPT
jgi:hypothetical protein